jgi:hypothetical protein
VRESERVLLRIHALFYYIYRGTLPPISRQAALELSTEEPPEGENDKCQLKLMVDPTLKALLRFFRSIGMDAILGKVV